MEKQQQPHNKQKQKNQEKKREKNKPNKSKKQQKHINTTESTTKPTKCMKMQTDPTDRIKNKHFKLLRYPATQDNKSIEIFQICKLHRQSSSLKRLCIIYIYNIDLYILLLQ